MKKDRYDLKKAENNLPDLDLRQFIFRFSYLPIRQKSLMIVDFHKVFHFY